MADRSLIAVGAAALLFDIPQDEVALHQWRAALPGHEVKGFRFVLDDAPALPARARRMYPGRLGWKDFDALHCRARAVWDPSMLHLAVDRVPSSPPRADGYEVAVAIVPYSGAPLLADRVKVRWRERGATGFEEQPLVRTEDGLFRATIPGAPPGVTIEYHVVAADASGRWELAPRCAPGATYRFTPREGATR